MDGEFTIHLCGGSADAGEIGNTFSIPLSRQLELQGEWCCCLKDFYCSRRPGKTASLMSIIVCSDMCSASLVNDKPLPVLAAIPLKNQLKAALAETYVTLRASNPSLSNITIYLMDERGHRASVDLGRVWCTLHFKRLKHGSERRSVDKALF